MKRDNGQSPARSQQLDTLRQRSLQHSELIVDGDPQCLERPRRRVKLAAPPTHSFCDDIRQLLRRLDGPRRHNRPHYFPTGAFFAIALQ